MTRQLAGHTEGDEALFAVMSDAELIQLRAMTEIEMRKRKLGLTVGDIGERLAIAHFRDTPGLPNLQHAPRGTKNVDALSRNGDRFSIKSFCSAKKTGTIYPDSIDQKKQLFEFLLLVRLSPKWRLRSIHQLSWEVFCSVRSWDKRMNAWYVPISGRCLAGAVRVYGASDVDG